MINIISFGKDKYAKSEVTDIVFDDRLGGREERIKEWVNEAIIYSITENDTYIRGESNLNFGTGSSLKVQDMFAFAKDAKGTQMLVTMNPYSSESKLLTSFYDIYFSCTDPRPLELNEGIKKNLGRFLEFQKTKLGN